MKSIIPIILILLLLVGKKRGLKHTSSFQPIIAALDKAPEFFVLEWKEGTRLSPKKTDFFIEVDSLGRQGVVALLDKNDKPVLYTSDISTPVCADGECKLMHIKLYWTLLGRYAGFDRYPELPLTKHDHDEFITADYQKLHELLINEKSTFKNRRIEQLVEKPTMRHVNGVDALSGATIAEVKRSVVSGALYSCYTAWHIVHGNIRKILREHTLTILNDTILNDMLYSENQEYQVFVLERLDKAKYVEHYEQIARIFITSTPLVRSIIAKSLMVKLKDSPDLQRPFWEAFSDVDLGTRSLLIKQLDVAPEFSSENLSTELHVMSKNQLKAFLGHLSEKKSLDSKVHANLKEFANSDKDTFAYLVKSYLDDFDN